MFFSSLKTLVSRVVIFSLQVRCSNVKVSTTIVKRSFHPMIILPYVRHQRVTNTMWACLAPTSLLPPARPTQASPPRTTQPPPLRIRSGFRGDVTQWLTTCKAGDTDRRVRRRFRGNVTQYLPVKACHLRLRRSRWACDERAEVASYSDLGPSG